MNITLLSSYVWDLKTKSATPSLKMVNREAS